MAEKVISLKEEYEVASIPKFTMPKPPLRRLLMFSPAIVIMATEIGGGELFLTGAVGAMYGGAMLWAVWLSAILKVNNLELHARYAMLTGESAFRAYMRVNKWFALIYALSFFVSEPWFFASAPIIIATLAFPLVGWPTLYTAFLAIFLTLILLTVGKWIYGVLEKVFTATIGFYFIMMVICAASVAKPDIAAEFAVGMVKPEVPSLFWLGALLGWGFGAAQTEPPGATAYVREKGFGVCHVVGKITGPRAKAEDVLVKGYMPSTAKEDIENFKGWSRHAKRMYWFSYFLPGLIATLTSWWLAMHVLRPVGLEPKGPAVAIEFSKYFGVVWGPIGAAIFLILAMITMFDTYTGVLDYQSRVHAQWWRAFVPRIAKMRERNVYYIMMAIWALSGILLMYYGIKAPLLVFALGSFLGAAFLTLSFFGITYVSLRGLPKEYWPAKYQIALQIIGILFFSVFTILTTLGALKLI